MGNCFGSAATPPPVPTPEQQLEPPRPTETDQRSEYLPDESEPSVPTPEQQPELSRPMEPETDQTSKSLSDGSDQKTSDVSSSHGRNENRARRGATVQDYRGTVMTRTLTSPSKHRAPTLSRVLTQDASSQRKPSHLSGLVRTNSVDLLGSGRAPQSGSFLTRAGEGQEGRQRFPSTLQNLLSNVRYAVRRCSISPRQLRSIVHHRFRILVVGKVRVIY